MTDDLPDESESDDEPVEPDVPAERRSGNDGGKVLSPEELDIADSEYVEQLDDSGRYVVSPGGGPPNVSKSEAESPPERQEGRRDRRQDAERNDRVDAGDGSNTDEIPRSDAGVASPEVARTVLADELGRAGARYGIDIVARFEGEPVRHRTVSNDVVATFENLIQWYARHVSGDTPANEVIEILLRESTFGTTGQEPNLAQLLESHDLEKTDSIADLVEAIHTESRR